jgi:hypothetical protein
VALRSASATRKANLSPRARQENLAVDATHTEVFAVEGFLFEASRPTPLSLMPQNGAIFIRMIPSFPGLVFEENHVLLDGLAADVQLIGGEVWVGIADCQTAQD